MAAECGIVCPVSHSLRLLGHAIGAAGGQRAPWHMAEAPGARKTPSMLLMTQGCSSLGNGLPPLCSSRAVDVMSSRAWAPVQKGRVRPVVLRAFV